jgi:hypothetical protein
LCFDDVVQPCLYSNWSSLCRQHLPTLPSSDNICHFLLFNFANVSYHCGVVSIAINANLKWTFIIHHCQAPTKCYTLIPCPPSCLALPLLDYLVCLEWFWKILCVINLMYNISMRVLNTFL